MFSFSESSGISADAPIQQPLHSDSHRPESYSVLFAFLNSQTVVVQRKNKWDHRLIHPSQVVSAVNAQRLGGARISSRRCYISSLSCLIWEVWAYVGVIDGSEGAQVWGSTGLQNSVITTVKHKGGRSRTRRRASQKFVRKRFKLWFRAAAVRLVVMLTWNMDTRRRRNNRVHHVHEQQNEQDFYNSWNKTDIMIKCQKIAEILNCNLEFESQAPKNVPCVLMWPLTCGGFSS